ncbi:MAG: SynChlorMet cassette protein ScmC [Desulfomonile tiedjei]|nr:SynChlorMet cassette protein ScmC [Desulfomonile tiedjei]
MPDAAARSYSLTLANSQSWQLVPAASAENLVRDFAAVMRLAPSDPSDRCKVIFTCQVPQQDGDSLWRASDDVAEVCEAVPRPGWRKEDFGRFWILSHPDVHDVVCYIDRRISGNTIMPDMGKALIPVFIRAQQAGGIVAHAALIAVEGNGVLLVGPSGMGKSTCARRLGAPWRALCDDEVLVVPVAEGPYHGHPLPTWSELFAPEIRRTWDVEEHVPLRAVCFLERSTENKLEPIGPGQAAILINKSLQTMSTPYGYASRKEEHQAGRRAVFANACRLVESVPSFMLRAGLTTRFWEMIEEVL